MVGIAYINGIASSAPGYCSFYGTMTINRFGPLCVIGAYDDSIINMIRNAIDRSNGHPLAVVYAQDERSKNRIFVRFATCYECATMVTR